MPVRRGSHLLDGVAGGAPNVALTWQRRNARGRWWALVAASAASAVVGGASAHDAPRILNAPLACGAAMGGCVPGKTAAPTAMSCCVLSTRVLSCELKPAGRDSLFALSSGAEGARRE
jgi:hypothetical protein